MQTPEQILSRVHEKTILIKEFHLDSFGHVNNAAYLGIFEDARWDIVSERGYGLQKVHELKIGPTILEVKLQFRREIKNRETITIKTWVTGQSRKVIHLRQVMLNSNGDEACVADFVIGVFDLKARKLIEPTPEFKYAIDMP